MTKQEKIDWGLRGLISKWTGEDGSKYLYDFSKAIREYLHSQGGVLLKENQELPDSLMEGQIACDKPTYQEMLRRANFKAVEPLEVE